jgi:DNA ligase-associated metallophosphoesterase
MLQTQTSAGLVTLLSEKALFLPGYGALLVADLHFGKINHFRQAGLPVPPAANQKNTETLIDLINKIQPARLIFLGDLFHSHYNEEWEVVGQVVKHFPACSFELVRGNHDIMSEQQYKRKGIKVMEQEQLGSWILTHEPMDAKEITEGCVNLSGHLHPGARLYGKGRQALMLPCFWLSSNQLILPAFGSFTGLAPIRAKKTDQVYVVIDNKVVQVNKEAPSTKAAQ